MSYTNVYPTRINWENDPSINTPINETNLNKMDYALYQHDQTFANWDTTKANQSDLLLSVKTIDYDNETGVFVFTWQNGITKTVDLNTEKIPVSFSMNAQGVITMTTDDGTQYTADVGALIKTYTFTDSTEIDFTVTTDQSGNKTVTASLKDGSIAGTKLQPNYLADCTAAKTAAELAETGAEGSAEDAEAWAVGQRNGVDVPSTDPAYQNNAKYWAEHTTSSFAGLTDTSINNPQNGQVPVYNSTTQKWENADQSAGGGSTIVVSTVESGLIGTTATITDGTTTLTATFASNGKATFTGVTLTGNLTLTYTDGTSTGTQTISIPYFGNYAFSVSFFSATITVTYPAALGATCSITDGTTTINATGSPMAFSIPNAGTWTATAILDGVSKAGTAISITTDGQTASDTIAYGIINLTFDDDFRGQTITCVNGGTTITKSAPSSGNTMAFYPPTTGSWTISGTVSGDTYYSTPNPVVVSSLSTSVSASLESLPNGSTVTPTDDIQTWLKCAGIRDKTTYTTLADVLADIDTLIALCADSNACDYMARSTTWASGVCADATAMLIVGKYDYCANALLGNSTWCAALASSTYWEYIFDGCVPKMTSNTTPSGEVTGTTPREATTYALWKAFDRDTSTIYSGNVNTAANNTGSGFIQYHHTEPVCIKGIKLQSHTSNVYPYKSVKVEVSNDGSTYDTIFDDSVDFVTGFVDISDNIKTGTYTKVTVTQLNDTGSSTYFPRIIDCQFYGRTEKGYTGTVIHSAVEDNIYYMSGGSQASFCGISSGDTGTVLSSTIEALKNQTITLYSSVAKDPTNLSNDYSKAVRITPNVTEIYLMPDKALYWWGHEDSNLEDCTLANGWSNVGSYSYVAPTHNTNNIYMAGGAALKFSGVGTKNKITMSNLYAIVNASTTASYLAVGDNKNHSFSTVINTDSGTTTKYTCQVNDSKYGAVGASEAAGHSTLYAMWYE